MYMYMGLMYMYMYTVLTLCGLITTFFGGRPRPEYKIGLERASEPNSSLKRDRNLLYKLYKILNNGQLHTHTHIL